MKGTIIFGAADAGKSRVAKLMTRNDKPYIINCWSIRDMPKKEAERWLQYLLSQVTKDVTMVYLVDFPGKYFDLLMPYLLSEYLRINPQNRPEDYIHPKITVECQDMNFTDLPSHIRLFMDFNFYTCVTSHDHSVTMLAHHPEQLDSVYTKEEEY